MAVAVEKRTFIIVVLALVTILVVSVLFAGYYYLECERLMDLLKSYETVTMCVNICINYGNKTVVWYNNTLVSLGCNLLNATMLVADVEYTYWPAYQASFVDSINGVANNAPYYWMWLFWDAEKSEWRYGPVGADCYILRPNEIVMWRYEMSSW